VHVEGLYVNEKVKKGSGRARRRTVRERKGEKKREFVNVEGLYVNEKVKKEGIRERRRSIRERKGEERGDS
jgi:hypothetical protein